MSDDTNPAGPRDVLDLGHRPHLDPTADAKPHIDPPKAELKPAPAVAEGGTPVPGSTLSEEELDRLSGDIVAALKTVYDPEIPADIYELGLIYKIDVDNDRNVEVDMTLTAPGCPVAGEMPGWVESAVMSVEGVKGAKVNLVFDPPWDQSRMSDEARLAVGMF
jgi:FeS assembly SUF system protein